MTALAAMLAGPLARVLADLAERIARGELDRHALEAETRNAIARILAGMERERLQVARDVLLGEMTAESWLQRNWRPLVAVVAFVSYWYVIVVLPHLVAFGLMPPPRFGETGLANLHMLTLVSIGGYMGARTVEKVARMTVAFRRPRHADRMRRGQGGES